MTGLVLRLARLDGGELVLDAAGLADVFFRVDPSSIAVGAYDSLAGLGASDRIEIEDILALNRTMRARSAHVRWESLPAGRFRHRDHRFEWTCAEFRAWVDAICARFGYRARLLPIGPDDPEVGPPSQMAVFERQEGAA